MRLAILGASGHGKVVADTAMQAGWEEVVFFDDAWPEVQHNGRWSVVGNTCSLLEHHETFDGVVVGIGNNTIRLNKSRQLLAAGVEMVSVIHPSAVIGSSVTLGVGSVVFASAVIQVDSSLGMACVVNTQAAIDHDCHLADGVHICPGTNLAGLVDVGEASWIGIGASIKQVLRIGSNVTVGAGAVVLRDVADEQTVVGVPAKPILRNS
ncbi:acetyltransferase [Halomonas sp. RA08-2]|uniref:acetyltransferase n=1 Tax=Halomonas sp. RA08-2 TaxID=3440842 RepID=UPI003EE9A460